MSTPYYTPREMAGLAPEWTDDMVTEACRERILAGAMKRGSRWLVPVVEAERWARKPAALGLALMAARRGIDLHYGMIIGEPDEPKASPPHLTLVEPQGRTRPKDPNQIRGHTSEFATVTDKVYKFSLEISRAFKGLNAGQYVVTAQRREEGHTDGRVRYVASRPHWDGRMKSPEQLGRFVAQLDEELWRAQVGDKTPAQARVEARQRGEKRQPRAKRTS